MFSRFSHSKYRPSSAGFGLIELMVSISIMAIIMGVVLVRQSSFDGAVLLRSEAYEIALALRELQQSAISASAQEDGAGDLEFRTILGAYFTPNSNSYVLFQDANNNGYSSGEERGQQGTIDNRFQIAQILNDGVQIDGGISITFARPNFDARFVRDGGTVINGPVEIVLRQRGGSTEERSIVITRTGQIAVR